MVVNTTGWPMDGVGAAPAPTYREWWERAGGRARAWLRAHPRSAVGAARLLSLAQWAAVALAVVVLATHAPYRRSAFVFVACYLLLLAWFLVARTKTVSWGLVAGLFALSVPWSAAIGWLQLDRAERLRISVVGEGASTAIAAFGEEALKLAPLAVLAVVAPARIRRLGVVDWVLLGLAAGLAFQAQEDALRRLVPRVREGTSLGDAFAATLPGGPEGPASGYPQYGMSLLSGESTWTAGYGADQVEFAFAGHHVTTALVAVAVGFGIVAWRRGRRRGTGLAGALAWPLAGVALPVAVFWVVACDHFGTNATIHADLAWLTEPTDAPRAIAATWELTGHGTGRGWLLLVLAALAMLVDAGYLHRAGRATDLRVPDPASGPAAPAPATWVVAPASVLPPPGAGGAQAAGATASALAVHAMRDVVVMVAAHARQPVAPGGPLEPRRVAARRGRASARMLRELRTAAMAGVVDRDLGTSQRTAAWRVRGIALFAGAALAVVGVILAGELALRIGNSLTTPGPGPFGYFASYLDALASWWDGLSFGQQLLATGLLAAGFLLAGLGAGLSFGLAGVGAWVAGHGHGLAGFVTDPAAATRDYLANSGPGELALDALDAGMTFWPSNFLGPAVGHTIVSAVDQYAADPAAARAGWRELAGDERGVLAGLDDDVERAFAESDVPSGSLYDGPARLARGNLGERLAADALAAEGFDVLSYKPDVVGTNQGGIDIVAMHGDDLYLVDNKALTRSGNVSSVTALTDNFAQNLDTVRDDLGSALAAGGRSPAETEMLQRAVDAIDAGRVVRAVTNANVAPDSSILTGVTDRLAQDGITFIDVFPAEPLPLNPPTP
jgi:hypothetical protein